MDHDDDDDEEPFCRVRLTVYTVLAEALIVEIEIWSSENDKLWVDDNDGSDEAYQHDLQVFEDELEMLELEVELEELDGIPPSPRTQIEGTVNVKAEHKGTGNPEKITSTDDICISQEEVQWLVKVDDELASEDQKQKERIGAHDSLTGLIYNLKSQMNGIDKFEPDEKYEFETTVQKAWEWVKDNQSAEKEDYEEKLKEVEAIYHHLLTTINASYKVVSHGANFLSHDQINFHDELERLENEVELDYLELEEELKELEELQDLDDLKELEELEDLEELEPENVHDSVLDSFQLIVEIEIWSSENDKVWVDDDDGSDDQHDLEVFEDELEMLELEVELEELDGIPPSPRFGRGTTIISHIQGDTICIVSDGRRCSDFESDEGLLLLQGDDTKIYEIDEKICCSTAGNVALSNALVHITKDEAQRSRGDAHKIVTKLQKELMQDKNKQSKKGKKKERGRPAFEAQFTVYALDRTGAPLIQLIGPEENTDAFKDGDIIASGTGGEDAKAHLNKLIEKRYPSTSAERMAYLKVSAAAMCLVDIHTGGFVQEATLSPRGLNIEEQRDHVIKVIANNFQHVADELKNKLLCITRSFSYSLENEKAVTIFLRANYLVLGES